jgi:hypothetical protein
MAKGNEIPDAEELARIEAEKLAIRRENAEKDRLQLEREAERGKIARTSARPGNIRTCKSWMQQQ